MTNLSRMPWLPSRRRCRNPFPNKVRQRNRCWPSWLLPTRLRKSHSNRTRNRSRYSQKNSRKLLRRVQAAEKKKESSRAAKKSVFQNLEREKQKISQATEELATAEQVQKDHEQTRDEMVKAGDASPAQITAAAFAHDNTYLALGDAEHRIQLLDASTGRLVLTLDDQPGPICAVPL